jgi:hypothetical protein
MIQKDVNGDASGARWVIMVKRSCPPSLRSNIPQTALVATLDMHNFKLLQLTYFQYVKNRQLKQFIEASGNRQRCMFACMLSECLTETKLSSFGKLMMYHR